MVGEFACTLQLRKSATKLTSSNLAWWHGDTTRGLDAAQQGVECEKPADGEHRDQRLTRTDG